MRLKYSKRLHMQLISLFLIALTIGDLANADQSTIERIKKHQEWLKQRHQKKDHIADTTSLSSYKKTYDFANLWRFQKQTPVNNNKALGQQQQYLKPSINDVYPENEVLITTMTSKAPNKSTITTTTSTTTAAMPTTEAPASPSTAPPAPIEITTITEATTVLAPTALPTDSDSVTDAPSLYNAIDDLEDLKTTTAITATNDDDASQLIGGGTTTAPRVTLISTTPIMTTTTTTTITTTRKPKAKLRPYPRWGNWTKWSDCSRSCGGGVIYQQRKCINRNGSTGKRYVSNDCIGVYRRYQLCNEQPCPNNELDFRAEQCAAYNDVNFQGRKYVWEPYIKEDAECELNCKPVGMKYFATLNSSVIDGTNCIKPAEYYRSNYRARAICVAGICKAIQASGLITGLSANSGSVSCGGLICRVFYGIFTRDPLPEDAYIHVATIPAGASNISITELKNSANLLVLRTMDQKYIFNGDNSASESGAYESVGGIFDYHRIDGLQHGDGVTEWITCTGPIREMLELMIYSKSPNPGIKYEYLLPIDSDSEESEFSMESDGFLKAGVEENSVGNARSSRRRKFNWKVIGFSTCTKSCGGGIQTPIIRCVRDTNPVRFYSQRRCTHAEKPALNENLLRCNTQPCPAFWRIDDWGECRCQQGDAFRSRQVNCVQELASGIVIHVDNIACMEELPVTKKQCECPKSRRRSSHGRYRIHNSTTSNHRQRGGGAGAEKMGGVWLISDWNEFCSADCGDGVEYRTIFCDRVKGPNSERCDPRSTPDITRPCEERACELGDWFAGPWSACNGNCFNLTRFRQVFCIQNQLIVEDEDCRPELRPQTMEDCSHEEVEYCAPRWHYSDWSECTKACDGGTQRRSVKCLEYDAKENVLRESNRCRYSMREPIYRSCNTHKCEEELPPRLELLQNDVAVSCVDEFTNCQWAVKAKLCSYDYYRKNCCYSCGV